MLVPTLVLLCAGLAVASKPLAGVDPSTLSCDPEGQRYLLLPHCEDCTKFFMCAHGQEVLFSCSGGLIFDFELQGCNWQWDAKCLLRDHGPGCGNGNGSGESSSEETEAPAPETTPESQETSEENSTSEETTSSGSQETSSPETTTPESSESTEESVETTPESVETTPEPEASSEEGSGIIETTPEIGSSTETNESGSEEASTPESEEGSGLEEIEGSGQGEVEWTEGSGSDELDDDVASPPEPAEVANVPIQPIASAEVEEIIAEHFTPSNLDCGDPASASRAVAYEGDCQRYWRCVDGVAESAYCVDGMFFNERSQQCDFESNVVCNYSRNNELNEEFILA